MKAKKTHPFLQSFAASIKSTAEILDRYDAEAERLYGHPYMSVAVTDLQRAIVRDTVHKTETNKKR